MEYRKQTVRALKPLGRRALVRADFNVPLADGVITDDTRIVATLPTLRLLIERGARVILMSHLGRPKGGPDKKYSLRPVAGRVGSRRGPPRAFTPAFVGPAAEARPTSLPCCSMMTSSISCPTTKMS